MAETSDISALKNEKRSRPGFWFYIKMVLVAVLIQLMFSAFASRFTIGWETQETKCLPFSFYLIDRSNKDISAGDYVVIKSDERMMPYYDKGSRIAKLVKAVSGDVVRVEDGLVFINDEKVGILEKYTLDKLNKTAQSFDRTLRISPGELWVQGTLPRTFDSRYWGPARNGQIVGKAYPLF